MKKLVFIFMIAAVLVSCKKNAPIEPINDNTVMQEVTFEVNTILEFTDRAYSVPNCNSNLYNDKYAEIVIEDSTGTLTTYFAEIYYVGGLPYTKAILLPVTDDAEDCDYFTLKEFYVWDNGGTAGYDGTPPTGPDWNNGTLDRADDFLFKAAPMHYMDDGTTETPFWDFAVNRVDYQFKVCAFEKTKILIDVLCFVPDDYKLFGFFWFEVTEITIREICFFGDFCLKDTYIYKGTEYETSGGGLFIDEPAIFEIRGSVLVNDQYVPMVGSPWNNKDPLWLGVGEPLCIQYADYDAKVDSYKFDLYLWAMNGSTMGWVYMYTFTWNDIFEDTYPTKLPSDPEDDGVYEFVVGNCLATTPNLLLPPYMNLPETVTMNLSANGWNGETPPTPYNNQTYWTVTLSDIGSHYDLKNGTYDGWCGDANSLISGYIPEDTYVFSTLEPASNIPSFIETEYNDAKMKAMTYLANHWYTQGIDNSLATLSDLQGVTVQNAIWMVSNASGAGTPADPLQPFNVALGPLDPDFGAALAPAQSLATDALNPLKYENYDVLPGGYVFLLFYSKRLHNNEFVYDRQVILFPVDP